MISSPARRAAATSMEAAVGARRIATLHQRLRAPLVAIDLIIDGLELGHLAGRTVIDGRVRDELEQLSGLIPLNEAVMAATDTRRLHAALLDLQEEVLQLVVPSRQLWTRQDEE